MYYYHCILKISDNNLLLFIVTLDTLAITLLVWTGSRAKVVSVSMHQITHQKWMIRIHDN